MIILYYPQKTRGIMRKKRAKKQEEAVIRTNMAMPGKNEADELEISEDEESEDDFEA